MILSRRCHQGVKLHSALFTKYFLVHVHILWPCEQNQIYYSLRETSSLKDSYVQFLCEVKSKTGFSGKCTMDMDSEVLGSSPKSAY